MSGTGPTNNPTGGAPGDQTSLDSRQHGQAQYVKPSRIHPVDMKVFRLDSLRRYADGTTRNLIDEAQLRQEPTDRDIGANMESRDQRGVLQRDPGAGPNASITIKSEARTTEGFKVGDEGDQHDLAAAKQP
ncbi:hypothetical protein VMCG_06856 [Cytospora schulzeri]|uniref:Uncharacterized protein n=1 Tax=Cytospora schulzeri TaxID=448051 RepID=A0A423W2A2_9PEZI|nr:hypothetical protein VMCG_06856 [Valsa malicola]